MAEGPQVADGSKGAKAGWLSSAPWGLSHSGVFRSWLGRDPRNRAETQISQVPGSELIALHANTFCWPTQVTELAWSQSRRRPKGSKAMYASL